MILFAGNIKKIWQSAGLPKFLFLFIAVWTAVVMFSGIRYGDLSGYDDAAYAHEAKTMLQSGDWWTMNLNGNSDFDKPPLFIWLLAISFKILGATDFAAKVPGVVLGWAAIMVVYFLARELFSSEAEDSQMREWMPVLSMLCMATTQYFLKYSSHAMTDVPFTFFFTLAVYFYVRALKNNFFLLASGVAIGLATLTRSPIGLFPLGIIVLHLIFIRRLKLLFSLYFVGCLLLSLAIPAIWYFVEYNLYGEIFTGRHFANILGHSASAPFTRTAWQHFLWYFEYLFLITKLYLPWFPLMFYGLYLGVRKIQNKSALAEKSTVETLLIIWVCVVLLPFSLVDSKVLRYILPAFPAFAILSAFSLYKIISPRRLPKFAQWTVLFLTLAALNVVIFPKYQIRAEDMHSIAPVSDAATAPGEKILLYTSGENQANFQTQLLWYGNRLCVHLLSIKEAESFFHDRKQVVVIMDKASFADLARQIGLNIKILAESENFVCFRVENHFNS